MFAAIEGATLALKILITIAITAILIGTGFFIGKHWEVANTMEVQRKLDKVVVDYDSKSAKFEADIKLSAQERKSDKDNADEQIQGAIANTIFYADELRVAREKNRSGPTFPPAPIGSKRPELSCFDRAAADRADEIYRREEEAVTEEVYGIIEGCTKGTIELNGVKLWAQKLPPGVVTFGQQ